MPNMLRHSKKMLRGISKVDPGSSAGCDCDGCPSGISTLNVNSSKTSAKIYAFPVEGDQDMKEREKVTCSPKSVRDSSTTTTKPRCVTSTVARLRLHSQICEPLEVANLY